ncbi:XdhC family protein [Aromatoleum diolicum]|uniref:XdhC/CoxI family protein n=1 Tax=Aromatoleum diolicum TaxID=75796 RepID=A0ABX1QDG3_9RHOO|nr:XdhC/CoxI family protein [Aromatoleum diolicum]NMG76461.1 XdhC/CoxI family protein [Aromatoleum diolicum]
MTETQRILQAHAKARACGEEMALATVVAVEGSTYRRPGARMLVTADGTSVGAISGGCLERDVVRLAARVLHRGEPVVAVYDSTDEEVAEGYALGCNGVVVVLIEPLVAGEADVLDFISACLKRGRSGVVATVFGIDGAAGAEIGARLMLDEEIGVRCRGIADEYLRSRVEDEAREALRGGRSARIIVDTGDGRVEVFLEHVAPPTVLTVFGAGHDAVPLMRFAKALGWELRVVTRTGGHGAAARFAGANQFIVGDAEEALDRLGASADMLAVVMTHNYFEDLRVMRALASRRPRYVAILGPKRRTERLLAALAEEGVVLDAGMRAALHGPAGLDIGAETPEEIALSILAEIQAVLSGRRGGFARDRAAPLHECSGTGKPLETAGASRGEILCGLTPA